MKALLFRSLAGLCAAFGFLLGAILCPIVPGHGVLERTRIDGVAHIASVPSLYPEYQTCELASGEYKLLLYFPRGLHLNLGDKIRVHGMVRPLSEQSEGYWLRHGVVGTLQLDSAPVVARGPALYSAAAAVRDRFLEFTSATLPQASAQAVDALCFGVGSGLPQDTRQSLQRTGATHIVSASGIHVLVLIAALEWLFGFLPVPRWARLLFIGVAMLFYACATGLLS